MKKKESMIDELIKKKKAESPSFAEEFEKESLHLDSHVAQALKELESGDVARFDSYEDLMQDLNSDDNESTKITLN